MEASGMQSPEVAAAEDYACDPPSSPAFGLWRGPAIHITIPKALTPCARTQARASTRDCKGDLGENARFPFFVPPRYCGKPSRGGQDPRRKMHHRPVRFTRTPTDIENHQKE